MRAQSGLDPDGEGHYMTSKKYRFYVCNKGGLLCFIWLFLFCLNPNQNSFGSIASYL